MSNTRMRCSFPLSVKRGERGFRTNAWTPGEALVRTVLDRPSPGSPLSRLATVSPQVRREGKKAGVLTCVS
jgi:hypothetical protein